MPVSERGGWRPVATTDGECRIDTLSDRVRVACRVLGMALLGTGIGCVFVFARWFIGIE